jgi:hypothetical protein
MRRLATVLVTLVTAAALSTVVAPPASAAGPRLAGRFDTRMTVTASRNAEPVGRSYRRVISFSPQCATGPCRTQLTRKRGDGKTISYMLGRSGSSYAGRRTYLAHCRLSSGYLVRDAYSYTENVTLTPRTAAADRVKTYTATMTLSFTPNTKGRKWRCRAGSQRMRWEGTWQVPDNLASPTFTGISPGAGTSVPGDPLQVSFTPVPSKYTGSPIARTEVSVWDAVGTRRDVRLGGAPWTTSFPEMPTGGTRLRLRTVDEAGKERIHERTFVVAAG